MCGYCEEWVRAKQNFTSDFDEALRKATRRNGKRPERIRWGLYGMQYHYICPTCKNRVEPPSTPAWTAIDWTLEGNRIGDASLSEKTLIRIQKGIDKFGDQYMIVPLDRLNDPTGKMPYHLWKPFATQTGRQSEMLVSAFMAKLAGSSSEHPGSSCRTRSVEDLVWAQTTTAETGLIAAPMPFIAEIRGGGSDARSILDPAATVCASGNHHMLVSAFYDKGYTSKIGGGDMVKSIGDPFGTVTARDHHGLVQVPMPLLDSFYRTGTVRPITEVTPTQSTHDRFGLIEALGSIDIMDRTYRMLQPHEIQRIQAFRDSYVILGSQRDKVRQLGNAVTPPVSTMLLKQIIPTVFG